MAKTGRKNKPTALHDLHGTGNSTRLKERRNEPVATGVVGEAPPHLSADQKADWIYAVQHMPAGVAGAIDRWALEVFIVAADHHRIANHEQQKLDAENALPLLTQTAATMNRKGDKTGGGNVIQSPYLGIMSTAGARVLKAAVELGFTPAARPRLEAAVFDPAAMATHSEPGTKPKLSPAMRDEKALDTLMKRRNETLN